MDCCARRSSIIFPGSACRRWQAQRTPFPGRLHLKNDILVYGIFRVKLNAERPFVFINVATTADGKLAPAHRQFIPFGSERDQEHLFELRATADAVLSGARTVDLSPILMEPGAPKFRRRRLKQGLSECHLRVIVSGSASVDPQAPIFKERCSPIIILAGGQAPAERVEALRKVADEVKVCGEHELDFAEAFCWLREKWGVKRLLCEGGGEVNAAVFAAGLVDEIHVTLCPLILGGRHAPTLADGLGVPDLNDATRLKLVSLKRAGSELFLVYHVLRDERQNPK